MGIKRKLITGGVGLVGLLGAGYMTVDYYPHTLKPNERAVVENIFEGYSRTHSPGNPWNFRVRGFEKKHKVDISIKDPVYIGVRPKEGTDVRRTTEYVRGLPEESLMLTGSSKSGEFAVVDIGLAIRYRPDPRNLNDYIFNFEPQYTKQDLTDSLNPNFLKALKGYNLIKYGDIRHHARSWKNGNITLDEALRRATYDKVIRDVGKVALRAAVGDGDMQTIISSGRAELGEKVKKIMEDILKQYGRTKGHTVGIQLRGVEILHAEAPREQKFTIDGKIKMVDVYQSYIDVNSAEGRKGSIIQRARAKYHTKVNKAKGEADRIVEQATGEAQAIRNRADAEMVEFRRIRQSILATKGKIDQDIVYETIRQESIRDLIKSMNVTIIPKELLPFLGVGKTLPGQKPTK